VGLNLSLTALRRISKRLGSQGSPEKVYPSYGDALRACSGDSYLSSDLASVIVEKTKRFKESSGQSAAADLCPATLSTLTSLLYALEPEKRDKLCVLDFGGAAGAHYFQVRSVLSKKTVLRWAVVETSTMVKMARVLEDDAIRFFEDIHSAEEWLGDCEFAHSSGALQYTPDPYLSTRTLLDVGAAYLLLTRLNLTEGQQDVVVVQKSMLSWNGIGAMPTGFNDREVRYPNFSMRKSEFEALVHQRYSPLIRFDDQTGVHPVAGHPIVGFGMLYKRL
jgi:putative methyltransferase (TIGR04325 family)